MTKKEFLRHLKRDNVIEHWVEELKREKLPLLLWGCGDVADAVYRYLKKCGVQVAGVLLDGVKEKVEFYGLKIMNRQEAVKEFTKFNVILGHSYYDKGGGTKAGSAPGKQSILCF